MDICRELYFPIHIFALLYILWFLICFQLFSVTKSLSSGQHCVLISVPTCCKLTFATWRLNLAVLARIDLLIIFESCLQEALIFFSVEQEILQVAFSIRLLPSLQIITGT